MTTRSVGLAAWHLSTADLSNQRDGFPTRRFQSVVRKLLRVLLPLVKLGLEAVPRLASTIPGLSRRSSNDRTQQLLDFVGNCCGGVE